MEVNEKMIKPKERCKECGDMLTDKEELKGLSTCNCCIWDVTREIVSEAGDELI